jgi:hypothetical protein
MTKRHRLCSVLLGFLLTGAFLTGSGWSADAPRRSPAPKKADPFKDTYATYRPDFLRIIAENSGYGRPFRGWPRSEKEMKLSSEPSFYTLNQIHHDSRADALVDAGLEREAKGQHRYALKVYQEVLQKYSHELYRVSRYGVFVPVSQYCQRRILGFPPADLAHYRTLHDARAKEAFEQARRKHSLIGLSELVDGALATTYGGRALAVLGDASLDNGHYLAASVNVTTSETANTLRAPHRARRWVHMPLLYGPRAHRQSTLPPRSTGRLTRVPSPGSPAGVYALRRSIRPNPRGELTSCAPQLAVVRSCLPLKPSHNSPRQKTGMDLPDLKGGPRDRLLHHMSLSPFRLANAAHHDHINRVRAVDLQPSMRLVDRVR